MVRKRRLRILEITNFSAGICGVWERVKQESLELSKKGYELNIFSSNAKKGSKELAESEDKIGDIPIKRFPFMRLGGESFMSWDFKKEALKYSPDIIIAHSYRHLHTTKALAIAEKLNKQGKRCKIFLVTHAPFERQDSRSLISAIIVWLYDKLLGKNILNRFDKVISITKWEEPFLLKIGCNKENIAYIPNGLSEKFFKQKSKLSEENKILFLGRISPIKNLEVLIKAIPFLNDKATYLELVGPTEEDYLENLKFLIKKNNVKSKILFTAPIYNLTKKINKIDSCKIFVLPSKSEGLPQALIEAMARKKIVIVNNIPASRDIIKDRINGFIFNNESKDLAFSINSLNENNSKFMKRNAYMTAKRFDWKILIKKLENLF